MDGMWQEARGTDRLSRLSGEDQIHTQRSGSTPIPRNSTQCAVVRDRQRRRSQNLTEGVLPRDRDFALNKVRPANESVGKSRVGHFSFLPQPSKTAWVFLD